MLRVHRELVLRFLDEDVAAMARPPPGTGARDVQCRLGCAPRLRPRAPRDLFRERGLPHPPRASHGAARARDDDCRAGEVGFLTVEKGSGYGIEEGYSEVCWFYDLDATPSMPEGPIAVNVFARLHDADAFLVVCRRMRLEGAKKLEIARE